MGKRAARALVISLGYMPSGRAAPERTRPRGKPVAQVLQDIAPQIEAMDELLGQCETRYGKRTRILDNPFFGPLTGAQWRKFHWVHGRHHLKQISRLRAME
jgi:hypothetical protein